MALRGTASVHREPCAKCNNPVFIAERLNVGKLLFHRTCFRCARCNNQLTLANYYETENNEYCCETCPDEEAVKEEELVLSRSLSDEEKSANLKGDDYSTKFESALENLTQPDDEFSKARSNFVQSQLEWESDSGNEEPPELPSTKPPDLKISEEKCNDSGFPLLNEHTVYASVNNVSDSETRDFVTKDESSLVSEKSESVIVIEDSVVTISDDSNEDSSKVKEQPEEEYPDDLNPFGDETEETAQPPPVPASRSQPKSDYDSSLNPFGSDDDAEQETAAPSPKPRTKKKILPPPEDRELPDGSLTIQRESVNPFEDDDDDDEGVQEKKEESPVVKKRVLAAPRITLTPFFWNEQKPVPLPRSSKYVAANSCVCIVYFIIIL